jgi:hypothetical protein
MERDKQQHETPPNIWLKAIAISNRTEMGNEDMGIAFLFISRWEIDC